MKRTYDDRRGYDRDRGRDRGRDEEASYYRDPSSAAASVATSPRASTSTSAATAASPRRNDNDQYDPHRSDRSRDRDTFRDRDSRDKDKYLPSTRGSSRHDRSRSRDRHHHHDRQSRDSHRHERDRQRSTPMSPSSQSTTRLAPPVQLATTVKESTPEEGEILPPAPAPAPASKSTSTSTSARPSDRTPHSSHHTSNSSRHDHDRDRSSRDGGSSRRTDAPRSSREHHPSSRSSRHDDRRDNNRSSNQERSSHTSKDTTKPEEDDIDYDSLYATSVAKVAPAQQKTPAEILEEKRKARAAILARYQTEKERSASATPQPEESSATLRPSAPGTPASISTGFNSAVGRLKVDGGDSPGRKAGTDSAMPPADANDSASDDEDGEERSTAEQRKRDEADLLTLERSNKSAEAAEAGQGNGKTGEEVSAADYDPEDETVFDDRRERERLFLEQNEQNGNFAKSSIAHGGQDAGRPIEQVVPVSAQAQRGHNTEEEEEEDEDDDDMFAVQKKPKKPKLDATSSAGAAGASKTAYIPVISRTNGPVGAASEAAGAPLIVDNFDDAEGYYRVILGETVDGDRYHLTSHLGKGMFSNVVRARDRHSLTADPVEGKEPEYRDVAIKIMRSQESMYRAGQKEILILKKLAEADPTDKKHVVRLERTFEHRGHLCLVFENLSMNLRDVIKRFGKDVGINLKAVRAYAHQIFLALNLFKKLNIMHADIKPDNILVNETKSMLKVCDLGSAADTSEAEITPYLVSRFYRAPEIILGLPYDCSLDMWSIACTLYELYTGKILFPGRSNNHMLYLIQELKGRYPGRLVKKSKFGDIHFEDSNFVFVEKAKVSGADTIKKMIIPPKGTLDLKARLMPTAVVKKLPEEEVKLLTNFVNLLERALELDPSKRLTPKEALSHPFLR